MGEVDSKSYRAQFPIPPVRKKGNRHCLRFNAHEFDSSQRLEFKSTSMDLFSFFFFSHSCKIRIRCIIIQERDDTELRSGSCIILFLLFFCAPFGTLGGSRGGGVWLIDSMGNVRQMSLWCWERSEQWWRKEEWWLHRFPRPYPQFMQKDNSN